MRRGEVLFGSALHGVLDVLPVAWEAFARAAAAQDEQKAERWAALCFGLFEALEDVDAGRAVKWTARDVKLAAAGWDEDIETVGDREPRPIKRAKDKSPNRSHP